MFTVTHLAVFAACFSIAYGAVFDPYSRRYGVCKGSKDSLLVTPPGQSRCTLIQGLFALTTKAGFTSAQNTTYYTFVQNLEASVIMNVSYTTSEAKFIAISAELQKLELEQSVIYSKVQYLNISTWGPVDMVSQITKEYNYEGSISLTLPTSASGNCKLFDLLLEACAGDSEKHSALQAFIDSRLKAIVADSSKSETEILVEVNKAFEVEFFVGAKAAWKTYFKTLKLKGYFAFSQWSQVAVTYQQKTEYEVLLSGQGMDCPFIVALNATLSMTTYTTTQKGFIKNLMNYFIQQWTTLQTPEERLDCISKKFSECIDLSYGYFAMLNSIPCGSFGSWWQLIILSCQKPTLPDTCGCIKPTWAPATTEVPTEATIEVSTTEATTEASSSTDVSSPSSESSTWDSSTFSSITWESSTPGCTCSCEA